MLEKIKGVEFNWRHNNRKSWGIIAQDVEQIMPDAVFNNPNGSGILISAIVDQGVMDKIFIDGSGSIIYNASNLPHIFWDGIYNVGAGWTSSFMGYIWDPEDNINVAKCAYESDAWTDKRFIGSDLNRCGSCTGLVAHGYGCSWKPIKCSSDKNCIKEMVKGQSEINKETLQSWNEVVIMDNLPKPIPYKGSAIFIHLTKNYKPTAGCIALKKKDLLILLKIINTKTKIKIN